MMKKLNLCAYTLQKWVHVEVLIKINECIFDKRKKVFDKYNEIWEKVSNIIKKINSELIYNKK